MTSPSWFTDDHPAEIEKFWSDSGSGLDTIANNIRALQTAGYQFVASFIMPEICWTDNYFIPRGAALKELSNKYPENKTVAAYIADNQYEVDLYSKYKQYYGYAFHIGKKI